ncbi:flagellar export protein FliJ [Sporosarcina sp. HYO08]|uniref:flagellar export protein FliJ n=1 Tax=Sporosarcina sp. HYO08 TaxID=1759557 RepID=UPI0007932871|nr:flagellar export protein FliJ [Sporosarcina sp. HYO08]KXH79982.1 flagellar biosynthesis chaperone [Sporosarcina sp. HYO08]
MKAFKYRFENVLSFREQEKKEIEVDYNAAVDEFKAVATELYDLLKRKEDVLQEQQGKMAVGFSMNEFHYYAKFINSLEKRIDELQNQVIQARSKMNWYENKLLNKTLEVKKFEKMREKDRDQYRTEMEQVEVVRLDELSTAMFRRHGIGG